MLVDEVGQELRRRCPLIIAEALLGSSEDCTDEENHRDEVEGTKDGDDETAVEAVFLAAEAESQ